MSEAGLNRVRIVADGMLRTVAGDPEGYSEGNGGDGGPATQATFGLLNGSLAVTGDGDLLIGDVRNHRVRAVDRDSQIVRVHRWRAG